MLIKYGTRAKAAPQSDTPAAEASAAPLPRYVPVDAFERPHHWETRNFSPPTSHRGAFVLPEGWEPFSGSYLFNILARRPVYLDPPPSRTSQERVPPSYQTHALDTKKKLAVSSRILSNSALLTALPRYASSA